MEPTKIVLVAGAGGFVGQHLTHELKRQGYFIIGTGISSEVEKSQLANMDQYIGGCDLSDLSAISKLPLAKVNVVINLAGLAQNGTSFTNAETYLSTNVAVHTNIAERLMDLGLKEVRYIAVSSGAVYDPTQPMPLTEESRFASDASPYAQSKIAMEKAMSSFKQKGLNLIIVRPFNHTGPDQKEGFLVPDLYKQLCTVKLTGEGIKVGNLKTKRDYSDVRDVAQAYAALAGAKHLSQDIYNVCSAKSISGDKVLKTLMQEMDIKNVKILIDPSKIRPNDAKNIFGSYHSLQAETGWQPEISFTKTMHDFVVKQKADAN